MKKTVLNLALISALACSISSCKKEEDPEANTPITSPIPDTVTIDDFTTTTPENPSANQVLGKVTASSETGTLVFSIKSQAPSGAFVIDATNGELSVADPLKFDFETVQKLTARVEVSNGTKTALSNVTVNLTDIDESIATTISVTNFSTTIPENPTANLSLGTVTATTNQGSLNYALLSQIPTGGMVIDPNTGELKVNQTYNFDYETNPTITAVVKVMNGSVSKNIDVTITLTDELPTITASDYTVTVPENPSSSYQNNLGTPIVRYTEGNIQYQILSQSPAGAVNINSSGKYYITDLAAFDYETNPVITAQVRLTVGTVTEDITATFTLTDLFENITASNLPVQTIAENPVNGLLLATATATLDGGATPQFNLQSESEAGAFQVNLNNGEITVKDRAKFNYENNTTLNLTLRITSDASSSISEDITFTVNLTDVANTSLEEKILDQGYTIQQALTDGYTPSDLINEGITASDILGNEYLGGIIFSLNPTLGSGKIVSKTDLSTGATWNEAISLATNSTEGGFTDWRLPYKEEFELVRGIDYNGIFTSGAPYFHWMNNAYDSNKAYAKGTHENSGRHQLKPKSSLYIARPVRQFAASSGNS